MPSINVLNDWNKEWQIPKKKSISLLKLHYLPLKAFSTTAKYLMPTYLLQI